jgi:hypothetical protein
MSTRAAASWLCLPLMAAGLVAGCERMCGSSNPEWDSKFSTMSTGSGGTGGMSGMSGVGGMAGAGAGGGEKAGEGGHEPSGGDGGAGASGVAGGSPSTAIVGMGGAGGGAGAGAAGSGSGGKPSSGTASLPEPIDCIESWKLSTRVMNLSLNDLVYNPVDNQFWLSTNDEVWAVDPDTGKARQLGKGTWQGLAAHPAGGVWAVNRTQLEHLMLASSEPAIMLSSAVERPVLVTDDKGELVWWIEFDGNKKVFSSFDTKSQLLVTGPSFPGPNGLVDLVLSSDDWLWYLGQANSAGANQTVLGRVKARSFDAMSRNVDEEVNFDTAPALSSVPTALVSMERAGLADSVLATLASMPHLFVRATTPDTNGTPVTLDAAPRKLTAYRNCGAIMTSPNGLKRLTFDGSATDIKIDAVVDPQHVAVGVHDSQQVLALEDLASHALLLFKPDM